MNFLQELLDSTAEVETPRSFWLWSGIATISAVVKDNVYLKRGEEINSDECLYKLYPNIYVMLHAASGLKKGPPIALAKKLVKRVNNTRIISGRSSIQGMLKDLSEGYTLPGGQVMKKSVAFIAASEFSSSIVEDKAAMTILTDLYDRNYNEGEWRSLLKMETFTLKDPTITLLVATNEAHFNDFMQSKDVHGGFIGRMFVINEKESAGLNSLVGKLQRVPNEERLVEYLKKLSVLQGPFASLDGTHAGEYYNHWYHKFYNDLKKNDYKDETGTIQRFGDSVLKVAMLMALANEPNLEISEEVMIDTIEKCEKLIGGARTATVGKDKKEDITDLKVLVLKEMLTRDNFSISHQVLFKKYWLYLNATNGQEVIQSLLNSHHITMENHGGVIVYVMTEKTANELKNFFEGKSKRK